MSFERPLLLVTLLLVPVVLAAHVLSQRRSTRYGINFPNLDVLAAATSGQRMWRGHLPAALLAVALVSLGVAMARPHVTRVVPVERATVILVIDTSRSMQSQDVKPSRLAAAKGAARTFLERVPNRLRVGLIVFSGDVTVAAPPTLDHEVVLRSVDAIGPYSGFGGTAIGDALARAVELGEEAVGDGRQLAGADAGRPPPPSGVARGIVSILFLSDGRQNRGILLPAEGAQLAKAAGIPAYTVALGTPNGGGRGGGAARSGLPGLPGRFRAPDPATLRAIARTTGGEFFEARSEEAVSSAYADLGSRLGRARRKTEVTFAFVGAAAAVLSAAGLLSAIWWPRLP